MRLVIVLFMIFSSSLLFAQQEDQERVRELEKQRELEKEKPRAEFYEFIEELSIDYGGWIKPQFFSVKTGDGKDRSRLDSDTRLWVDIRYEDIHSFYFRTMGQYYRYGNEDNPDGRDRRFIGPKVDILMYQFDLSRVMKAETWECFTRIGRQYHRLGLGLLFNSVADGISARFKTKLLSANLFALRTLPHQDDLDTSLPNSDDSKRDFYGGMLEFTVTPSFVPYIFGLIEEDRNSERPESSIQDFEFDTDYTGIGLRGYAFTPRLTYTVEGIQQTGTRFAHLQTSDPEKIDAWATISDMTYYTDLMWSPRFSAGYIIASGDVDRSRVQTTTFGNVSGTKDNAFLAFGYYPTGYALNPLISNIEIVRLGAAMRPVQPADLQLTELEVGVDVYSYKKNKSKGAISDPYMTLSERAIGKEIDIYASYVAFSDLSLVLRYGIFEPDGAPTLKENRQFFLASIIYSF